MRLAGIGRLADVAWGILEPRGKISFIQRLPDGEDEPPPNPRNAEDDASA